MLADDPLALLDQHLEDIDQHAVVAQQHLGGDLAAQRHDARLVVARDVVGRAIGRIGDTRLGARIDRAFDQSVDRPHVDFPGGVTVRASPVSKIGMTMPSSRP